MTNIDIRSTPKVINPTGLANVDAPAAIPFVITPMVMAVDVRPHAAASAHIAAGMAANNVAKAEN